MKTHLADCLSRWHTDAIYQSRFKALTVALNLQPVPVNPQLFSFTCACTGIKHQYFLTHIPASLPWPAQEISTQ